MEVILIVIGLILGLITGWLFANSKSGKETATLTERNNLLTSDINRVSSELLQEREKVSSLSIQLAESNSENKNLNQRLEERVTEMQDLQKKFTSEFEALASKILDEKSSKFTTQNKENLESILKPLRERIFDFEQKIDMTYKEGMKERVSLAEQIKNLQELNLKMSEEANNLTKALKGDSKTQGAWGEFLLETMLEKSGLVKGREYELQSNFTDEDGKRRRPDAIIYLPEDKNIIIDSKVSLTNYERHVSAETEKEREEYLKLHMKSVRDHVKNLSGKN
jgi:DNA recombination protein RmuC